MQEASGTSEPTALENGESEKDDKSHGSSSGSKSSVADSGEEISSTEMDRSAELDPDASR